MHTLRLGWNFICSLGHQMSGVMCANEWEVNVKQNHCLFVEAFGTILFPEITTCRKKYATGKLTLLVPLQNQTCLFCSFNMPYR